MLLLLDDDLRCRWVFGPATTVVGWSASDLRGRRLFGLDLGSRAAVQALLDGPVDARIRTATNGWRWVTLRVAALPLEGLISVMIGPSTVGLRARRSLDLLRGESVSDDAGRGRGHARTVTA